MREIGLRHLNGGGGDGGAVGGGAFFVGGLSVGLGAGLRGAGRGLFETDGGGGGLSTGGGDGAGFSGDGGTGDGLFGGDDDVRGGGLFGTTCYTHAMHCV
jgi:hypothetical protein